MKDTEIKALIRDTIKRAEPTAEVILFGSRARGTAREDSDWDVLVLVDSDTVSDAQFSALNYDLWTKGLEWGQEINVHIRTKENWNSQLHNLFKLNVLNDAVHL